MENSLFPIPVPIQPEEDFHRAVRILETFEPRTEEDFRAFECLAQFVNTYQDIHYPLTQTLPHQLLHTLMEVNRLSEEDVANIMRIKISDLTAVLRGQRPISEQEASLLGERFCMVAEAFLL